MNKVWIVQCSEASGGYVLGVYDNQRDAGVRLIEANRNTFCASHTVTVKYVSESEGTEA